MPLSTELADALVAAIGANDWGLTFTPESALQPSFELKELKELKVTVVPRGVTITQLTRVQATHDYHLDVGIQKKLQKGDVAECTPLLKLAEDFAEFFRNKRLGEAAWLKSEIDPLFAPEHFEQYRQFTSIVTFTFRVTR